MQSIDKVFSYLVNTDSASFGENKDVAEALTAGYRVIDVITTPYQHGVVVTVILTNERHSIQFRKFQTK